MQSLLSFIAVIIFIMVFSKKDLGLAVILGAILLALATQVPLLQPLFRVLNDPSIMVLAFSVAIIPVIGGVMQETSLITEFLENINISKKLGLVVSPAVIGMLPMPGGALFSAPLVEQIEPKISGARKTAINVWFRHNFIIIYPIQSSLIAITYLSNIDLYDGVLALMPSFFLMLGLGYWVLLKPIEEDKERKKGRNIRAALRAGSPLLIAPLIDIIGRSTTQISVPEIYLAVGVTIGLFLATRLGKLSSTKVWEIAKKGGFWNYSILILGMFYFLYVFTDSGVPEIIGGWNLPLPLFLVVCFLLGVGTGRIQLPASVLVPIYLTQYGITQTALAAFALIYTAIFLGYVMTPVHPCIAYTLKYFSAELKPMLKLLFLPIVVTFAFLVAVSMVI